VSKSNSIPYESCSGGDQALAEIAKILAKFGCQSFGHMTDAENGKTIVQFKWREPADLPRGELEGLRRGVPQGASVEERAPGIGRAGTRCRRSSSASAPCARAFATGSRARSPPSSAAVMSFGAVFMPHMLLPTGERVIDRVTGPNGYLGLSIQRVNMARVVATL
jgi:hypothetical protein